MFCGGFFFLKCEEKKTTRKKEKFRYCVCDFVQCNLRGKKKLGKKKKETNERHLFERGKAPGASCNDRQDKCLRNVIDYPVKPELVPKISILMLANSRCAEES